jgi:hypothetical protein
MEIITENINLQLKHFNGLVHYYIALLANQCFYYDKKLTVINMINNCNKYCKIKLLFCDF